ncbi:MAG: bifunctional nuclease family protein [Chitinophagia bacterium]|jgi:bifunctional DNase/RNase
MRKIEFEIVALSHSVTQTMSYAVVLAEVNGTQRLPIVIGGFEAQAIAVVLENMQIVRPLTHDLLKNFMRACHVDLQEVIISDLQEGIFYSKLICHTENDIIEIDSRTSDALALAVRFGCPIYIYEDVLRKAEKKIEEPPSRSGKTESEEPVKSSKASSNTELSRMSLEELHQLLNEVLEQEDYIRAISIRDEINKRK